MLDFVIIPYYLLFKIYLAWFLKSIRSTIINIYILSYLSLSLSIYTVGTESIQTPLNVSLFVILQPFAKII